jgi:hypothetical protein
MEASGQLHALAILFLGEALVFIGQEIEYSSKPGWPVRRKEKIFCFCLELNLNTSL